MGPGAYDPDKADHLTKTKVSTTVNMGASPDRGSYMNRKGDAEIGPGQYDDRNYEFGSKSKGFIIGEKREQRTVETMGPGAYDPSRADAMTKTKTTTTVNMSSAPARGSFMNKQGDANLGPGQYDDRNYEIASKSKGFTIAEKRETRI